MDLADFTKLAAQPPPLRFLVIGGYAVAAHGHSRSTHDVDFLGLDSDRDIWKSRAISANLQRATETSAFIQFEQEHGDGLDIMLVKKNTFEQLWDASVEKQIGKISTRVPSLDHLFALKLHALKQKLPHRTSKDAEDLEMLARRNKLDLTQPHYEELFLKYGSRDIYETILRVLRL